MYRIATYYGDQTVPYTDVRGANSPSQDISEGYKDSATPVLREFMERMQPRSWSAPGAGPQKEKGQCHDKLERLFQIVRPAVLQNKLYGTQNSYEGQQRQ